MNLERAMVMLDFLEAPEELGGCPNADFNMRKWECGTQACFAGWAARIFKDEGVRLGELSIPALGRPPVFKKWRGPIAIAHLLDLDNDTAGDLCTPEGNFWDFSRRAAAERLRNVIENEL